MKGELTMVRNNLVTDYYEYTMGYSYFRKERELKEAVEEIKHQLATENLFSYDRDRLQEELIAKQKMYETYRDEEFIFDVFYRKNPDQASFCINNGLADIIDYLCDIALSESDIKALEQLGDFDAEYLEYLKNIHFTGDVMAIGDGEIVFPNEPLLRVQARKIEAQIIETKILLLKNYQTLVTTKANRIVRAADHHPVMEFGTRRAHTEKAAVVGSKCAYIAGAIGTACVETYKLYPEIPPLGTMAHSYVQAFSNEYEAFLEYAKTYPENATFLIDTYDVLASGIINAIRVAKEYLEPNGHYLRGVRIDSGNLLELSRKVRILLDSCGMYDTKIVVSNSLDEYSIQALYEQGAPIDSLGVGENLITAKSDPVLGGVYKLAGVVQNGIVTPKIKISASLGKITNPGCKNVYRFYDKTSNLALGDVIALENETVASDYYFIKEVLSTHKELELENYNIRKLLVPIFRRGQLVYKVPSISDLRMTVKKELSTLREEYQKLQDSEIYPVGISNDLYQLKQQMLRQKEQELMQQREENQKVLQYYEATSRR